MKIEIYTDGGCRGNHTKNNIGAYAAVLKFGGRTKEMKKAVQNTTNNQMEIMACIEALRMITDSKNYPVAVMSDSAYVVNCMNKKWYEKWMNNGWLTAKKKPVENRELWMDLIKETERFGEIEFVKVKGHSNDHFNNKADALVNEAMNEMEES